jgi:hypothetical protein
LITDMVDSLKDMMDPQALDRDLPELLARELQ